MRGFTSRNSLLKTENIFGTITGTYARRRFSRRKRNRELNLVPVRERSIEGGGHIYITSHPFFTLFFKTGTQRVMACCRITFGFRREGAKYYFLANDKGLYYLAPRRREIIFPILFICVW